MNRIYIDMDGVLADFDQAVIQRLGLTAEKQGHQWSQKAWAEITKDPHFYRGLPKMKYADRLFITAQKFRDQLGWELSLLTAIPHSNDMPYAIYDKLQWAQEYYPEVPLLIGPYSEDKARYHCSPGDIIVDDNSLTVDQWRAKQGLAVQVTDNYLQAVTDLDYLFNQAKVKGRVLSAYR